LIGAGKLKLIIYLKGNLCKIKKELKN